MNYTIFFALVGAILAYSIFIGKQTASAVQSDSDYFLAGRKMGFFKIFMTVLATQLGGGAIIGTAEAAYSHGWKSLSYSSGIALGLVFLTLGLGSRFRKLNVSTIPEIFKTIYNSDHMRTFASLIYIFSMFILLVAIGISARKFALAIGFNNELIFILFWGAIIAYTTTGGLNAVTKTDILQIIFVLGAFALTFIFLPKDSILLEPIQNSPSIHTASDIPWINWLIIPCLSTMIGQDMAQRCFAAKTPKIVPYSLISAAIILILATALPAYLGILGHKLNIAISKSSVLIDVVLLLTNPYVTSIFSAAILMAILSTADSILCAVSSNISLDLNLFKTSGNQRNVRASKLITILVGVSAMFCSFLSDDIIPMMISSYEITISTLFVPVIAALVLTKPHQRSAYGAVLFGLCSFLYFSFFTNYMYKTVVCITVSVIVFAAIEIFLRNAKKGV
ncbi:MAG: sodium:solute symporter family protein [Alphaproteobacteria bacterium]|nr:sodium:solute symporter family protein [Alphaproteobacteria bacterium]